MQCLQGGYGSAELIPHLDFDAMAGNPKPFVGYSDITALHVALRQRSGLATFYGYGLVGMGDAETTRFTGERLLAVLSGERPARCRAIPTIRTCARSRGGKATAPLVGGCLWLLMQTMGTPWELETRRAASSSSRTSTCRPGSWTASSSSSSMPANWTRSRGVVVGEMAEVRLAAPRLERLCAHEVGRGRARGAPRAARRPRALPAPARARQAPGRAPARSHGDARRGRTDADNRRAGAFDWVRPVPRAGEQGKGDGMRTRMLLVAVMATLAAVLAAGCGGGGGDGEEAAPAPPSRRTAAEQATTGSEEPPPAATPTPAARSSRAASSGSARPATSTRSTRSSRSTPQAYMAFVMTYPVLVQTTPGPRVRGRLGRQLGDFSGRDGLDLQGQARSTGPTARRSPPRTRAWTCNMIVQVQGRAHRLARALPLARHGLRGARRRRRS